MSILSKPVKRTDNQSPAEGNFPVKRTKNRPFSLAWLIAVFSVTVSLVASYASVGNDLWEAVVAGDLPQVRTLLEKKNTDIDHEAKNGATVLIIAAGRGHKGIVQALLDNGAEINHQTNDGWTALMIASQNGHSEIVQVLLEHGAAINHQAKTGVMGFKHATDGWTAMMMASQRGHSGVVQTLLDNGAEINHQAKSGETALMIASRSGHLRVVQALLDSGAEINYQANDGETALMFASELEHSEIVQALLNTGAEINYQNKHGVTALIIASQNGHSGIVQTLLDRGAEINYQTKSGETALMITSARGHAGIAQILVSRGAEINYQTINGVTALMLASELGQERVVQALLDKGAEINYQNKHGVSALIIASYKGHQGTVEILLAEGANVDLRTEDGATALKYAKTKQIKQLLEAAMRSVRFSSGDYSAEGKSAAERYAVLLKERLLREKRYPREARLTGKEGEGVARFVIDRKGTVLSIHLEQSTGHQTLDHEVIDMIERAEPFPPVPIGVAGEKLELRVPVSFDIEDVTGDKLKSTVDWHGQRVLTTAEKEDAIATMALPDNGMVRMYVDKQRIAPLQIVTKGEEAHYLVKLVDWNSNQAVQTIFIRAGGNIDTTVPLGSYSLKYAAGETWLGDEKLFGDSTIYKKAKKRFDFEKIGTQVSGYRVELILQPGGNLPTAKIPKSEW